MDKTTTRTLAPALAAVAAAVLLAACGPQDGSPAPTGAAPTTVAPEPVRTTAPVLRGDSGVVTAVVPLRTQEPTSGAGAVIGGVVGGALGNQVGKGDGRKAATLIGIAGGAYAGNQVEKQRSERITGYRVDIRLDDGRTTSVTLSQADGYASGQRVRVVDGALQPA
jgi:outer membrane lipoprotein SlyB